MTFEAPLIRETCEACDGTGEVPSPYHEWVQHLIGHKNCDCCNGSGWLVTEVEQDGPATITSIRSTESAAKQHERWSEFRARIAPWARVPEGTS